MDKMITVLSLMASFSIQAMDDDKPYKPTIAMTNPDTGEGYLSGMPAEMKLRIIMAIRTADTLQEAGQAIKALAVSNKELNQLINDPKVTKGLVHMLVARFGGYHSGAAEALATQGAKKYIRVNSNFIDVLKIARSTDSIPLFIKNGADVLFSTPLISPLSAVIMHNTQQPIALVHYLLEQGAPIDYVDSSNVSLLEALYIKRARPMWESSTGTMVANKYYDLQLAGKLFAELLNAIRKNKLLLNPLRPHLKEVFASAVADSVYPIVRLLLSVDASPLQQTKQGVSLLALARNIVVRNQNNRNARETLALLEQAQKDREAKKQYNKKQ